MIESKIIPYERCGNVVTMLNHQVDDVAGNIVGELLCCALYIQPKEASLIWCER